MNAAQRLNYATREFFKALDAFTAETEVDTDNVADAVDAMVDTLIGNIPESSK